MISQRVREVPRDGTVPRLEVPGWRERYGVVAGITTRGRQSQPFDLRLAGEGPGELTERWQAFLGSEPGFDGFASGHQIHGTHVMWHDAVTGWLRVDGVDGHASGRPGVMLLVTVADCIPVYLVAPEKEAVAILHAGWRGASRGIVGRGLEVLSAHSKVSPRDVVMHCGVGICGECFEVGSEVLEAFGMRGDTPGPWAVDLRERLADEAAGLGVADITISPWCTKHDHRSFFSHRASGGTDGRMVAYLGYPKARSSKAG